MNTNTNVLYKDKEIAELQSKLLGSVKQVPYGLQDDAIKALGDREHVYIPKESKEAHIKRLAQFALGHRRKKSKKKNHNRSSSQSRRKNRR